METIKVNMNPNPLDVQTIHASQNDGEARQWEFELHNNGELIDTSDVKEQLVFKAYKGGTEQLLPENGSTPTTSPFKGDIRYPQGLLTDQEFTYRQSPTEEDGLAKITDIKGNTLNWNQLVGRTDSYTTSKNGVTVTITGASDKSISLTAQGTVNLTVDDQNYYSLIPTMNIKNEHKYLLSSSSSTFYLYGYGAGTTAIDQQKSIFISTRDALMGFTIRPITSVFTEGKVINETFYVMFIDLTQMFGSGNEPTTVEEFTSLFSLPYYAYNQGSLLSLNGNGIKTVGKNQLDPSVLNDLTTWQYVQLSLMPNTTYVCSSNCPNPNGSNAPQLFALGERESADIYTVVYDGHPRAVTTDKDGHLTLQFRTRTNGAITDYNWQIEIGTTPSSFEPYTSSTLSLPISTYFPTGMKDVPDYTNGGKIYDEMTSNKADTRVGSVDLGTLDWTPSNPSSYVFRGKLANLNAKIPNASDLPNALLANYLPYGYGPISGNNNGCFAIGYRNATDGNVIIIIDNNYSTLESFISHITGQFLFYELATPTETPITTASLVTENAEIPLSNEDGVLIGKCTEQLSENPGFIDAKIKLSDADGECYSNKLQLHVERSPQ